MKKSDLRKKSLPELYRLLESLDKQHYDVKVIIYEKEIKDNNMTFTAREH